MTTTNIAEKEKRWALRHPEKRNKPMQETLKKPSWIRAKAPTSQGYKNTRAIVKENNLHTVCEEASCPNIGECWSKKHATFMIMGDICTRACAFCNVITGKPNALNPDEPKYIGEAIAKLGLEHAVITSVDRDDIADRGAKHFAETIREIRNQSPNTTIEVLVPDFQGFDDGVAIVVDAKPDVFNHNCETVPRLYPTIRPGARYFHSLRILHEAKKHNPMIFTKSGLMVGLGEEKGEVAQVMDDYRAADVDFITIGQYLQPTPKHAHIDRFVTPEEFESYAKLAKGKGFLMVASSPMTRSSYLAGDDFAKLQAARKASL